MAVGNQEIAVVIPCYNAERYLAAALESVLSQSVAPAEIVVVDDGSSDGSVEVARRYAPRVRCVTRKNGGVSSARNAGISLTRAPYLLFLDADDLLVPCALEVLSASLGEEPRAGVAFGLFEPFQESPGSPLPVPEYVTRQIEAVPKSPLPGGGSLFEQDLFSPLLRGSFIPMGGTMVRRRVFDEVGGFDEEFRVGEDRDLWLRATLAFRFICVNEVVLKRRLHDENLTGKRHQQLYRDFNVRIAHKLLASPCTLPVEDREYLKLKAIDCARASARHHIGVGEPEKARRYVVEYGRWRGWGAEALLLFALTLVPGSLLFLAARMRRDASSQ